MHKLYTTSTVKVNSGDILGEGFDRVMIIDHLSFYFAYLGEGQFKVKTVNGEDDEAVTKPCSCDEVFKLCLNYHTNY